MSQEYFDNVTIQIIPKEKNYYDLLGRKTTKTVYSIKLSSLLKRSYCFGLINDDYLWEEWVNPGLYLSSHEHIYETKEEAEAEAEKARNHRFKIPYRMRYD